MIEGFPPDRFLAKPLHDHGQSVNIRTQSNLPFELCSSHSSSTPSGPWLRLAGLDILPSTHLKNHRCTEAAPTGYSKAGSGEILEV